MGKRKSKSGKQKPTKKKTNSRLSKISSRQHNGAISKQHAVIQQQQQQQRPKVIKSPSNGSTQHSKQTCDEQQEFRRQMLSLAERSRAMEQTRKVSLTMKRSRRKQQQQQALATITATSTNPSTTPNPLLSMMKPASFSLTKSTNQLMEETTHQMGQIMSNGNNVQQTSSSLAKAFAATIAATSSDLATPIASNTHKSVVVQAGNLGGLPKLEEDDEWTRGDASCAGTNRNSFRALNDSDSDDDENQPSSEGTKTAAPLLSFAPASFSLGNGMWPTKTPPVTPRNPQHRYHLNRDHHKSAAAALFETIDEEEIEERHYQRQTGRSVFQEDHDPDL